MSESVPCRFCGKPSSVHLTQVVGDKVTKVDICQSCAQKQGMIDPAKFSLAAVLGKQLFMEGLKAVFQGLACPNCGCTVEQFKKTGRLGCPQCYSAFKPVVETLIKDVHQHTTHQGKVARNSLEHHQLADKLVQLEAALKAAVAEERFEDAARVRDEIKAIKSAATTTASSA